MFGTGQTISAADVVNGGAGTDTLTIAYDTLGDVLAGAVISNIEVINLRSFVAPAGVVNITMAEQAGVNSFVLSGTNAGTIGLSSLINNEVVNFAAGTVQGGTVTTGYTSASTAAAVVYNGGTQGALTVTGTGLLTQTLTSSTAATTIGTLTLSNTETTLAITANTNLTTGQIVDTALKTITVTGAGAVNIGASALPTSVTSVNASALTGSLTVTSGANTTSITGGSGDDRVTIGSLVYDGTGKLDGGTGGTDTLVITDVATATVFTTAAKANITGFDVLEASSAQTRAIDFEAVTGLSGFNAATATELVVSNLGAATAVTVIGNQTTNLTLNVKGATAPGTSDTLTVTLDKAGASAVDSIVTVGNLTSDGLEILNIVSQGVTGNTTATTDNNVISSLAGLATSNVSGINISGISDLTLTTGAINRAVAFNSSTATGNIIIDGSGSNTSLLMFNGGSGKDAFTGAAGADTISGGAGNDVLKGLLGNDVINGGDGADAITGNRGADVMTGGDGSDTFTFRPGDTYAYATTGTAMASTVTIGTGTFGPADGTASVSIKINGITVTGTAAVGADAAATDIAIATALKTAIDANSELASYVSEAVTGTTSGILTITAAAGAPLTVGTATVGAFTTPWTTPPTATTAVAATNSTVSSGALTVDSITDLNLGGATSATGVDKINLSGIAATELAVVGSSVITGASLSAAVNALFNTGGALNGTTNTAGLFTFGTDTYLIGNVGAAGSAFGTATAITNATSEENASDFIIKVTGVTGTLDASDFTFV